MIMRELIKKAGHIADKLYLKEHEKLFQGQHTSFKICSIRVIATFRCSIFTNEMYDS